MFVIIDQFIDRTFARVKSFFVEGLVAHVRGVGALPHLELRRDRHECYATVAMVTDYDCWHPNHDDVTVDAVVKVLFENADRARALVRRASPRIAGDKSAVSASKPRASRSLRCANLKGSSLGLG
jgi:purine nucleoside phosphorylase